MYQEESYKDLSEMINTLYTNDKNNSHFNVPMIRSDKYTLPSPSMNTISPNFSKSQNKFSTNVPTSPVRFPVISVTSQNVTTSPVIIPTRNTISTNVSKYHDMEPTRNSLSTNVHKSHVMSPNRNTISGNVTNLPVIIPTRTSISTNGTKSPVVIPTRTSISTNGTKSPVVIPTINTVSGNVATSPVRIPVTSLMLNKSSVSPIKIPITTSNVSPLQKKHVEIPTTIGKMPFQKSLAKNCNSVLIDKPTVSIPIKTMIPIPTDNVSARQNKNIIKSPEVSNKKIVKIPLARNANKKAVAYTDDKKGEKSAKQSKANAKPAYKAKAKPANKIKIKKLVLRPWQTEWAEKAYNILQNSHRYVDTSKMGSGKTFVLLWLAIQYGLSLIVVAPKIILQKWRKTAAEHGVDVIAAISYQSLRSVKGKDPKHGFLERIDEYTKNKVHKLSFKITDKYKSLVNRGILLVFDEFQLVKNDNDQHKACNEMIKAINTEGGNSRYALLSGTPISEEEQILNIYKLLGYLTLPRLYHVNNKTKEIILDGILQIIDAARQINKELTEQILYEIQPVDRDTIIHLSYILYVEIFKDVVSGSMCSPQNIKGTFDIKNGYFDMGQSANELQKAVKGLSVIASMGSDEELQENNKPLTKTEINARLMKKLVKIENAKIFGFANIAKTVLNNNKNNKVIIALNYNSTLNPLANMLAEYEPLILNGTVKDELARWEIVYAFNNDVTKRLLIMNTQVGGVGIDLHDTDGRYPRFMFISPSYKMIDIVQAADRIYRDGTMSDATVRMFYGKGNGMVETNILNSLARKSNITKGVLGENNNTIFPSDYENEFY